MNIYDSLLGAVHSEYDVLMLIKKSERGEVSLVRHRDSGTRYIFRHFYGNSEVYQKLLNVSCPNLPQIMEVGEKDGKTALLEEYVQGDTLSEILEGGLLTIAESKQIARQLCSALWVFHSMGVVHRDVKPDNVIIRGKEAVLSILMHQEYIKAQFRKIHRFWERPDLQHRSSMAFRSRMDGQISMRLVFYLILC